MPFMTRRHGRRLPGGARHAGALAALLLGACATVPQQPVPQDIRHPPAGDLQLVEARQDPERHLGSTVRWGGTVVAVERDAGGNARVEVLERRLDEDGRPLPGSASDGRFVIRAAPEVDQSIYRRGSEITIAGTLEGVTDGRIGEEAVRLPVVRVHNFVQWPSYWRRYPYAYPYPLYYPYSPYGYDPWFYGPRIGPGPFPYRRFGAYGRYRPGPFRH